MERDRPAPNGLEPSCRRRLGTAGLRSVSRPRTSSRPSIRATSLSRSNLERGHPSFAWPGSPPVQVHMKAIQERPTFVACASGAQPRVPVQRRRRYTAHAIQANARVTATNSRTLAPGPKGTLSTKHATATIRVSTAARCIPSRANRVREHEAGRDHRQEPAAVRMRGSCRGRSAARDSPPAPPPESRELDRPEDSADDQTRAKEREQPWCPRAAGPVQPAGDAHCEDWLSTPAVMKLIT